MSKLLNIIKTALKNKVVLFIFSRYGTYLIHFINSLFIAVYLGPYYLGIWGFITLVTSYMNHLSFGIADSVTAIISVNKDKEAYVQKVISSALTMLLALSVIAILLFSVNAVFKLDLGNKYNFSTYAPVVVLIGVLGYFNTLFNHVFRVYGKLFEIAFSQTVFPILMLLAIILFRNKELLWAMVFANFLAFLLGFILYLIKMPVKIKPIFNYDLFKTIQIKGWHLFVYNTSFFFIVISTRTLVSGFYSVEEFGYFTFAFSLANVMLLLLQSLAYLIYPKMLNRFAASNHDQNTELLKKLRDAYVTTSHLLIHIAMLIFPVFLLLFPQYIKASEAFKLIALSVLLYTNSFGYSGLLVAKGFEKRLGKLSFTALIINLIAALVLIKFFQVPFTLVVLATMISYFFYVYMVGRKGRKMLELDTSVIAVVKDIYPLRLLIPYVLSLVLILFAVPDHYLILSLVLFLILNLKVLLNLKSIVKSIILNPKFINI
ncbi:oligosaccharide flippase family protein [Winogradskyella schleiferi]|uniref:oligosaccharide flippase family protein n=1 Tax=Winogradskyella schleiferi TaxID=2686078 RepID=UPI0015BF3A20|nr:oligosaccharide flippase family protein [Winogradskyella schleiferi]